MLALIPFEPRRASDANPEATRAKARPRRRWLGAAAGLAVGAALASAATIVVESRPQARLAESALETQSLAKAIERLGARLDAIDSSRSQQDLADLRRSLGDIKSHAVSPRDLDAALTQFSKRIDSFDREANAKVDKLGERVDHDTALRTAELVERLDKLEKKAAAPPPAPAADAKDLADRLDKLERKVAAAPPAPAATDAKLLADRLDKLEKKVAAAPSALVVAETKGSAAKTEANVSTDRTGTIDKTRPILRGYVVLDAGVDGALLASRWGEREVVVGDVLPGAGRIERIARRGSSWVVETENGLIPAAAQQGY